MLLWRRLCVIQATLFAFPPLPFFLPTCLFPHFYDDKIHSARLRRSRSEAPESRREFVARVFGVGVSWMGGDPSEKSGISCFPRAWFIPGNPQRMNEKHPKSNSGHATPFYFLAIA